MHILIFCSNIVLSYSLFSLLGKMNLFLSFCYSIAYFVVENELLFIMGVYVFSAVL